MNSICSGGIKSTLIERKKMKMISIVKRNWQFLIMLSVFFLVLFLISQGAFAADDKGWGGIAKKAKGSIEGIGELITAGSYLAGLAFSIGAIMKFKQHKDNPTQVTVGTPISLTFIAAALLFLPSILSATGSTLFENPETAGPTGTTIKGTKGGGGGEKKN